MAAAASSLTFRVSVAAALLLRILAPPRAAADGQLELRVVERDSGRPLACRIHLKNSAGRAVKIPKALNWGDHSVFAGSVKLKLPKGGYSFVVECGPEYLQRSGHFQIEHFADDSKTIDMKRFVDMSSEGWWSGDLDVRRAERDLPLLMQADDLHVAALITWSSAKSEWTRRALPAEPVQRLEGDRTVHLLGGEDAREGALVHFLNLARPLDFSVATGESPSTLSLIGVARKEPGAWIDAARPATWDLPAWVAAGAVDTFQIANRQLEREKSVGDESGFSRDKLLFPDPHGGGRWSETIYHHLLNCGLRIPPTAGSGSGLGPNPLGYNRVYAYLGSAFDYDRWCEAVRAGRVMVTNGPLIRAMVEGEPPGHVFQSPDGKPIELEIGLTLSTRDKIRYLQIIRDGRVEHEAQLDAWKAAGGKLPPVRFESSGWFLVRAVAEVADTYRFATTGPFYVEVGDARRISKRSAKFFVDWIDDRSTRRKPADGSQQAAIAAESATARTYWQDLLERANAE